MGEEKILNIYSRRVLPEEVEVCEELIKKLKRLKNINKKLSLIKTFNNYQLKSNFCHKDIKPENEKRLEILMDKNIVIKLNDYVFKIYDSEEELMFSAFKSDNQWFCRIEDSLDNPKIEQLVRIFEDLNSKCNYLYTQYSNKIRKNNSHLRNNFARRRKQ